jgi:hypothetical protein
MNVLHSRCCGLDVHKSSISACILLHASGRVQKHQHRFGAMTQDLHDLAHWLKHNQPVASWFLIADNPEVIKGFSFDNFDLRKPIFN